MHAQWLMHSKQWPLLTTSCTPVIFLCTLTHAPVLIPMQDPKVGVAHWQLSIGAGAALEHHAVAYTHDVLTHVGIQHGTLMHIEQGHRTVHVEHLGDALATHCPFPPTT